MAIKCADCGGASRVIDSRNSEVAKRRRRQCIKCGERWSTLEVYESEFKPQANRKKHIREAIDFLLEKLEG